ncbi:hypothetical protein BD413DRAFT_602027 [Trametes elegans]|nr:hypothetical protein BD413DRAFT_602027 [Trametes elegans]
MPARIPNERNVVLGDYYGGVLAGFYQYGLVSWETFFKWLSILFDTRDHWIVVSGDRYASEQYFPTNAVVMPGKYTLLASDWSPLRVKLTSAHARRPQPKCPKARNGSLNLRRTRERDLAQSTHELSWRNLQGSSAVSHPYPLEHAKPQAHAPSPHARAPQPYPAPLAGSFCRSTLQNMFLLRDDLQPSWADYEFSIDPDDEYRITPFVAGHDRVVGRALHVERPSASVSSALPLNELLRDHFLQGLLKHVKGRGERHWDFGPGALDLSDVRTWGTEEGKERLELELENRLYEHRLKQCGGEGAVGPRVLGCR